MATAKNHKAIDLVDRMIQTVKHRLSCIKLNKDEDFKLKKANKYINYQMSICKQHTFIISHFEALFER